MLKIEIRKENVARLRKASIGNSEGYEFAIGRMPITLAGIRPNPCSTLVDPQLDKISQFGLNPFPLFPNNHT